MKTGPRLLLALLASTVLVAGQSPAPVDPWLDEALKPWRGLRTISMNTEQVRGFHTYTPKDPKKDEVSRTMTWGWTAEPLAWRLDIVGGPQHLKLIPANNRPEVKQLLEVEYGRDWRSRTVARSGSRFTAFDPEKGVIETGSLVPSEQPVSYAATVPLPLVPFIFLRTDTPEFMTVESVLLEQLRDPAWVQAQWIRVEAKTVETEGNRRIIRGSLPPMSERDNPRDREPFEVVLERDPASGVPVVISLDHPTLGKATFTYAQHKLADGSPIPVCATSTLPMRRRPDETRLVTCVIDQSIAAESLVIDVSLARKVRDIDTGAVINVDSGGQ